MRFKIDENLPVEVADLLRANMHDAMTIFDQHMIGELDPKVASVCKSEERALITLDLDFSDIRT
jgi:predicted nuclease of predicted toxin-antitoxin system